MNEKTLTMKLTFSPSSNQAKTIIRIVSVDQINDSTLASVSDKPIIPNVLAIPG
jgi:hypothetical protein